MTAMSAAVTSADGDSLPRITLDAYSGGIMYPVLAGVDWNGPVVVDIDGLSISDRTPIHRDHDTGRPIGHVEQLERHDGHIVAEGPLSVPGTDRDQVLEASRNQFPWRASIGMANLQYERLPANAKATVNGLTFNGPLLIVRSGVLSEISVVTVAGDENTAAMAANLRDPGGNPMTFAQWLELRGFNADDLSQQQLDALRADYDAQNQTDPEHPDTDGDGECDNPDHDHDGDGQPDGESVDRVFADAATDAPAADASADAAPVAAAANRGGRQLRSGGNGNQSGLQAQRAAAADEVDRVAAIQAIGDSIGNPQMQNGSTLVAHAIREGWSVQQTTLEARRGSRPNGPAIHSTSPTQRGTVDVLQAAVMLRAGANVEHRMPQHHMAPTWMSQDVNNAGRQRVMEQANEFRDLSLVDFAAASLRASGRDVPTNRQAMLQASFSTGSVAAVFTQSVGAMALAAYRESGDFSVGWTSESDELNLLEHDRPRLEAAPDLQLLPADGTSDPVHRNAVSEKVKVDRFSRSAKIDEIDFINDNFNLLRETPADFGRAAARLRPNLVAAVLLANANLATTGRALFNTTDGSLIATNPLSRAAVEKARAALAKRKDGDASLNLRATHLIAPSDLGDLAIQLTMSAVLTNDGGSGGTNPVFTRSIQPLEESRLSNGVTDPVSKTALAGSATSWYLASAEAHTIEVQFLQGTGRMPDVRVQQLQQGQYGLFIDVVHYCGAKALDFRGLVRSDQ